MPTPAELRAAERHGNTSKDIHTFARWLGATAPEQPLPPALTTPAPATPEQIEQWTDDLFGPPPTDRLPRNEDTK